MWPTNQRGVPVRTKDYTVPVAISIAVVVLVLIGIFM